MPTFEYTLLPAKENKFQYVEGQIFDENLYSLVNNAKRMLKYNIKNNSSEFMGSFSERDFKWTGGCEYNGILYFFPRAENCLLLFEPKINTFSKEYGDCNYKAEHNYGGICTKDGIIYQPPRDTDHILKWNFKNINVI